MWQYGIKIGVTVIAVVAISELGRRSSFWGALLASLPLTSLLGLIWLYQGTQSSEAVASLSQSIFWLVLASLPLFIMLPLLLRSGMAFWPSLGISCMVAIISYFGLVWILSRCNIPL